MRTIRASEIGSFLYCQRAWWYAKQGFENENTQELLSGSQMHQQHGRAVIEAGCLRWVAMALILLGLVTLTVYFTSQLAGIPGG